MFKKNRAEVRQREYDCLRSHIFLQQGDNPQTNLSITWVDVPPGACQMLHRHAPEQVYVIIEGRGRMRVGAEEAEVVKGKPICMAIISVGCPLFCWKRSWSPNAPGPCSWLARLAWRLVCGRL